MNIQGDIPKQKKIVLNTFGPSWTGVEEKRLTVWLPVHHYPNEPSGFALLRAAGRKGIVHKR